MRRVVVVALVLVLAGHAAAYDSTPQPVIYTGEKNLFSDVDYDTNWVPAGSPIQVRFVLKIGTGWRVQAGGNGDLSWPEPLSLRMLGSPDAGLLHMSIGVELSARLRLHLDLPGGGTLDWEGNVPFIPHFDYRLQGDTLFTPFLLPGATPDEAVVSDSIPPATLFQIDLLNLIGVDIPGISGGFELRAGGDVTATLAGVRFDLEDGAGFVRGTIAHDPGAFLLGVPEQGHLHSWPNWHASLNAVGSVVLVPAVYVEFAGNSWDLPLFSLPLNLIDVDLPWDFGTLETTFPLPDIRVPEQSVDFGTVPAGGAQTRELRIDNRGELPLLVDAAATGAGFGVTPATLTVGPGATGYVVVAAQAPAGAGALRLASNDPDQPVVTVTLRAGAGDVEQIPGDGGVPLPLDEPNPAGGCGCRAAPAGVPALALLIPIALTRPPRRRRRRG